MASRAISVNFGIYFVGFITGIISVVWMGFWTYTVTGLGVFQYIQNDAANATAGEAVMSDEYFSYQYDWDYSVLGSFALLLSLYWTLTVLAYIVQTTTTAGVTGTWCYDDKNNAESCCSSAVIQSLFRSCTYSLGSICFGALLEALVSTLRVLVRYLRDDSNRSRENNASGFIYCILACILFFLENTIEFFNEWAYVFVGIWGLDYLESGKRVMELFTVRGINIIMSDVLATYVLYYVVSFTSLVCGVNGYIFGGDWEAFAGGWIVGFIISVSMMTIVQGAVKAVIVCYADHPQKMFKNHPEDTTKLTEAIAIAYPSIAVPVFNNMEV